MPPSIDTYAVISVIAAAHPAPALHLLQYYPTEPIKWYVDVLRLIVSCPYHQYITHEYGLNIDVTKATIHPHIDSSILQQLNKVFPKDTMVLF